MLLYLGRPEEALPLFTQQLETDGDDLWTRGLRGFTYLLLNQPAPPAKITSASWDSRDDPRLGHVENRSRFASAACHLAFLTGQGALLDEAIAIYQAVRRDPIQRVDDSLGCCYLARGARAIWKKAEARFNEYIRDANDGPSLESLERFDLPLLETRVRDLPHGKQALGVVERIRPALAARRAELDRAHPRTEAEEIERSQEQMRAIAETAEAGGWTWIAAQATRAHWHTAQKQWAEALALYQQLLSEALERFPESDTGLLQCLVGLQDAGDEALRQGRAVEAKRCFQQVLEVAAALSAAGKDATAGLHARLGCAGFQLGSQSEARAHFAEAMRLYGESGESNAGEALGAQCVSLLPGAAAYWALDAEWQALADSPDADEKFRTHLPAARRALGQYLNERYQLSSGSGKSAELLPVVTPIAVEVGAQAGTGERRYGLGADQSAVPGDAPADRERYRFGDSGGAGAQQRDRPGSRKLPGAAGRSAGGDWRGTCGQALRAGAGGGAGGTGHPRRCGNTGEDPLTGGPGCWVGPAHWAVPAQHNVTMWEDPLEFMVRHIEADTGAASGRISGCAGGGKPDRALERNRAGSGAGKGGDARCGAALALRPRAAVPGEGTGSDHGLGEHSGSGERRGAGRRGTGSIGTRRAAAAEAASSRQPGERRAAGGTRGSGGPDRRMDPARGWQDVPRHNAGGDAGSAGRDPKRGGAGRKKPGAHHQG